MPIDIIVPDRDFRSKIKNGKTFTLNLSDKATHLIGSKMEDLQALHQIDVAWFTVASVGDQITSREITNPITQVGTVTRLDRDTGDWTVDGWSEGDTFNYIAFKDEFGNVVSVAGLGTILTVSPSTLIMTADLLTGDGETFGGKTETENVGGDQVFIDSVFGIAGRTDIFAGLYSYGLPENSEAANYISKVDGTEQSFEADGIGIDGGGGRSVAFVNGQSLQPVKGWQSGDFKVRFVLEYTVIVDIGLGIVMGVKYQRFQTQHRLTVLPYIKRDDVLTVQSLFESLNSPRYVFRYELRNVLSNENTSKIAIDDYKKGSVASFNENFNGFNTPYFIDSVVIVDSGANVLETLEIGETNSVTVVVKSSDVVKSPFVSNDPFMVYHSFLPEAGDDGEENGYLNREETYKVVWLLENERNLIGAGAVSNSIITNVTSTFNSTSQITITFDIAYTNDQQNILTDQDQFVLGIQVANDSKETPESDKVILDFQGQYTKNTDVEGLLTVTRFEFFDYPTLFVPGAGFSDFKRPVESPALCNIEFNTNQLLGAKIERLSVNWVAHNASNGKSFTLKENIIELNDVTEVDEGGFDDVQQVNLNTTAGFNYPAGEQLNFKKFISDVIAGNDKPYNVQLGIKADWRDWEPLEGVDTIFLNFNQPQNGFNKLIANYAANGYTIHVALVATVSSEGINTPYITRSPALSIQNYDDNGGVLDWACIIETFNEAGDPLGDLIATSEMTRVKGTWTSPTIDVTDVADYYAKIRIEEENNPTQDFEELGSERANVDEKLIPLPGESFAKKTIGVADSLVVEGFVNDEELDPSVNYKLSIAHGLIDSSSVTPGGKLMEDGTQKQTEAGVDKVIE